MVRSVLPLTGRFAMPAALPPGEQVLWQGAPQWRALARNALHFRGLSLYLGLMVLWVLASAIWKGEAAGSVLVDTGRAALVVLVPLGLALAYAWMTARVSAYTITNRRVVMRMGLALPVTLNLPFTKIDGAALAMRSDGTGDVALQLVQGSRGLGVFIMWPHTRLWGKGSEQPMLRGLVDAQEAGAILASALTSTLGTPGEVTPEAVNPSTPAAETLARPTGNVDTMECHHGATTVTA